MCTAELLIVKCRRSSAVRHGPEYKGNMDFTKVLCKQIPAYPYKPSQTYFQWKFKDTQIFETQKMLGEKSFLVFFLTKKVKDSLNLAQIWGTFYAIEP